MHPDFNPPNKRNRASLIIMLAIVGCLSVVGHVQASAPPDALTAYEQKLYSNSYPQEPILKRLERLERSIFGEAMSGSVQERQARLIQALGTAPSLGPSGGNAAGPENQGFTGPANSPGGITQFSSPGYSASQNGNNPNPSGAFQQFGPFNQAQSAPARPPDATDYPTVTALEREVFGRDFIREDISNRLDRLERKVFGQNYPQTALVDRVDQLLARYPGVAPSIARNATVETIPANSALHGLPNDPRQFIGSSRDVYTKLDEMEKNLFNGQVQPNALLTERLDRLENHVYGRTFTGQSVDTRLSRLTREFQVAQANSASGFQSRPSFQNRQPYQQPAINQNQGYPAPGYPNSQMQISPARQNIQFGAGMSSSSNRHQFSPEMMSMLPPDIRAQLNNQNGAGMSASSQGTVMSAPSTVVIERSTSSSGFTPYGRQPIQYHNYYSAPGSTTQSRSTTTVIQPDGSSAVYGYSNTMEVPGNGQGFPMNPAYIGDPAFLQTLNNLEINVFKQVNMVEPVHIRLGRLESAILGQIYVGHPNEQRLANLQRAYQLQSLGSLLGKRKGANIGRTAGSALLGVPLTTPNPVTIPQTNP